LPSTWKIYQEYLTQDPGPWMCDRWDTTLSFEMSYSLSFEFATQYFCIWSEFGIICNWFLINPADMIVGFIETWLMLYCSVNFNFILWYGMLGNCNDLIIFQTHMGRKATLSTWLVWTYSLDTGLPIQALGWPFWEIKAISRPWNEMLEVRNENI